MLKTEQSRQFITYRYAWRIFEAVHFDEVATVWPGSLIKIMHYLKTAPPDERAQVETFLQVRVSTKLQPHITTIAWNKWRNLTVNWYRKINWYKTDQGWQPQWTLQREQEWCNLSQLLKGDWPRSTLQCWWVNVQDCEEEVVRALQARLSE